MNPEDGIMAPDGPREGLRNVGRIQCERHEICRARVCPYELWKNKWKPLNGEEPCFFLKEAHLAEGTKRFGKNAESNPNPAYGAREIASFVGRTYINTCTGEQLRACVNETQR